MRLFFSIPLPGEVRKRLEGVLKDLGKTGVKATNTKFEQMHITLLFLGEKTETEAKKIIENAKGIDMHPFRLAIRNVGFFPNDKFIRIVWAGAEDGNGELKLLHSRLSKAASKEPEKDFFGHATLARIKARRNINNLKAFGKSWSNAVFGEFDVKEFALMNSELTPEGAKYTVVEKFQLG
ncbi:MAG: RNA 2',3'-cyclic phosphodiesterase [Candidatus Micrarchaeota archaeon]